MSNNAKYSVMVALGAMTTGMLPTMIKLGLSAGVSLSHLMLASVSISFVIFAIILVSFRQYSISKTKRIRLFLVGLTMGLTAWTFTKTVECLPASVAVVLQFQFVWIGVLLDAVYRKQWPGKRRWLMIALILSATVLAAGVLSDFDHFYLTWGGVAFGLLCAICYSFFLFFNAHVVSDAHWSQRTFYIMVGCLASTLVLIIPNLELTISGETLGSAILYGGLMAVLGYAIPIVFFAIGIPRIGSGISSILCACELPMAVIVAMLILGEKIAWLQWVGVVIIFVSLFIREPDAEQSPQR